MVHPSNAQEAVPMGLDIPPADWQQTPPSVQTLVLTLLKRLDAVEARLTQDSTTSQRPPSADSPYKKAPKPAGDALPRKAGGQPGHPGHRQSLLAPTDTRVLTPHQCACGDTTLALTRPYHTHQVTDFSVVLLRPNFMLVSEEHSALHQKSFLGGIFTDKMGLFGLEKPSE
jgi:Family of unknown function (DUF6444)